MFGIPNFMKMQKILLLLSFLIINHIASGQGTAVIVASITNPSKDSIEIKVEENDVIWQSDRYHFVLKDGRYQGNISLKKPSFFWLREGSNYVNGFIEPGDTIVIRYDANKINETLSFEGSKRTALQIYNQLIQYRLRDSLKAQLKIAKQTPYPFDHLLHYLDSLETTFLNRLNDVRNEVSESAMTAFTGYIKAQFLSTRYHAVSIVYSETVDKTLETRRKELSSYSLEKVKNLRQFDEKFKDVSAYVNAIYGILFRYYDGLLLEGKAEKAIPAKFEYLASQIPPRLRTPVLTMFIEFEMGKTNDANEIRYIIDKYFTDPGEEVYNSYVYANFQSLAALKKGLPAPPFTLMDEKGERISLENLKGKVVYMDFWFASCAPCHALFKKLKPVKEHFRDNQQVVFLNVSIDSYKVWKESRLLPQRL
jgi:thiol-disulfide isomerase/thioredoxin